MKTNQGLRSDFEALDQSGASVNADMVAMRTPLGAALVDTGLTNVAAHGVNLLNLVNGASKKVTEAHNRVSRVQDYTNYANPRYGQLYQQMQQLASELGGNPGALAALQTAQEALYYSSGNHQAAARSAGWGDSAGQMGQGELNKTPNDIRGIAGDSVGRSVAGHARTIAPFITQAREHMLVAGKHHKEALEYHKKAGFALEHVERNLLLAEESLSGFSFESLLND